MSEVVLAPQPAAPAPPPAATDGGSLARPPHGRWLAFAAAFLVLAAVRHWTNLPDGLLEVVAVFTAVAGLVSSARDRRRLVHLRLFLVVALAFTLVALVSVTQSTEPEAALKAWTRLVMTQSLGLGCYLLASERHRLRWFTAGALAGVGFIAVAAAGAIPTGSLPLRRVDDVGRAAGPVGDPNFFGQFLAIGFALAIGLLIAERRLVLQVLGTIVAGGTVVATLASESRGTLLAMLAAGVVVFMLASRAVRIGVCVLIAVALVMAPGEAVDTMVGRLARTPASVDAALESGSAEDTAVGGRLSEALASLHMLRDHPVLGVGIGSYKFRYQDYSVDIGIDRRAEQRDAHNRHLEVAAETGLVGVISWIALLVACASLCLRSVRLRDGPGQLRPAAVGWSAAFVAWFVTAFFLHDYQPELEWLVIGGVFGMAEAARASYETPDRADEISSSYSATSASAVAVKA